MIWLEFEDSPFSRQRTQNSWPNASKRVKNIAILLVSIKMIGLQYFYAFQTGYMAGIEDSPFSRQRAKDYSWRNAFKRVKSNAILLRRIKIIGLQYFYAFQTSDMAGSEDIPFVMQRALNSWRNGSKPVKNIAILLVSIKMIGLQYFYAFQTGDGLILKILRFQGKEPRKHGGMRLKGLRILQFFYLKSK